MEMIPHSEVDLLLLWKGITPLPIHLMCTAVLVTLSHDHVLIKWIMSGITFAPYEIRKYFKLCCESHQLSYKYHVVMA